VWYDANGKEIKRETLFSSHYPALPQLTEVGK